MMAKFIISSILSGLNFFGFAYDLEEEFGVKVDLVTYKAARKSIFLQDIEEVILYEKFPYSELLKQITTK